MAAKLYDALEEEAADDYLEAEICQDFRDYSKYELGLSFLLGVRLKDSHSL